MEYGISPHRSNRNFGGITHNIKLVYHLGKVRLINWTYRESNPGIKHQTQPKLKHNPVVLSNRLIALRIFLFIGPIDN